MTSSPGPRSVAGGGVSPWLCPDVSGQEGSPLRRFWGGPLPAPGPYRGAGGRRRPLGSRSTPRPPARAGFPGPFVRGHRRREHGARARSRAWRAIRGGRPGTLGARAPWPQITGARRPPARPGSPPAPWNAITGRASGPPGGGEGRGSGPRAGRPRARSHGEVRGCARASPGSPAGGPRPVRRRCGGEGAVPPDSGARGRPVLSRPLRWPPSQGRTGAGLFSNVS